MALSKAEMEVKIAALETKEAKSLTYEGLASLIIQQGENDKEWRDDFKEKFTEFKEETKGFLKGVNDYNEKQNGRQADMFREIARLKKEFLTRGLTCKLAVEEIQKVAKDKKTEKKEDKIQKLSKRQWVALFILSIIVGGPSIIQFIQLIFK